VTLESPVPVVAGQKVWLAWLTQSNLIVRMGTGSPGQDRFTTGLGRRHAGELRYGHELKCCIFLICECDCSGRDQSTPGSIVYEHTIWSNYGVNFNASASSDPDGTIVSWAWNFGDGTTGNGQTVSHTYANGNTYTVTLTVTDNNGATGTLSQNVTPVVVNAPPVAQFTTTPTGVYGIDFNATGSSDPDGTIVSWAWNFGDGTTGNGQTVSHTYANGNTRTVTLTVTDNGGATGTLSQQVTPLDMTGGQTVQVGYTTVFPGTFDRAVKAGRADHDTKRGDDDEPEYLP
jgi:chitodextrinase